MIKIAFIGGGSQSWAPTIIRDIIFKEGMEEVEMEFSLLDTDMPRALAVKKLFDTNLRRWKKDRIKVSATLDPAESLTDADFVIITISTGRLPAMRYDLKIPEKYGIYHTVGDTTGPGGWARALRNIPVFEAYAKQIKDLAPNAFVLNYTNPMGVLTKVLSLELGYKRVVGLCHGVLENYSYLKKIFGVEEKALKLMYGGLNHFFWVLDFWVNGKSGYPLLEEKLQGRDFDALIDKAYIDAMGWHSDIVLASELYKEYGYLPYFGDRHTCEYFSCYITSKEMMERYKLVRTSVEERAENHKKADEKIRQYTLGKENGGEDISTEASRETAADMIKAIVFDEGFTDVVNLENIGQISNLPLGAVVETPGYVDASGFTAMTVGPMPEQLKLLITPFAESQIQTVEASLSGDLDSALMALVADPVCAKLTASDIKKMGMELLEANKQYLPQFFR